MKRQRFRLGNVLRYYELQKQRAELDLQRAVRVLQETDREIARLQEEIAAVADLLRIGAAAPLTSDGWLACYRKTDHLAQAITAASQRRRREAEAVAACEAVRRKWSVAEETLSSLRQEATAFNHDQAEKAHQEMLDETVLRQWIRDDSEATPHS